MGIYLPPLQTTAFGQLLEDYNYVELKAFLKDFEQSRI